MCGFRKLVNNTKLIPSQHYARFYAPNWFHWLFPRFSWNPLSVIGWTDFRRIKENAGEKWQQQKQRSNSGIHLIAGNENLTHVRIYQGVDPTRVLLRKYVGMYFRRGTWECQGASGEVSSIKASISTTRFWKYSKWDRCIDSNWFVGAFYGSNSFGLFRYVPERMKICSSIIKNFFTTMLFGSLWSSFELQKLLYRHAILMPADALRSLRPVGTMMLSDRLWEY